MGFHFHFLSLQPRACTGNAESLGALGLGDDRLDGVEDLLDVAARSVGDGDAHVADTEVGRGNVLVETAGNHNVETAGEELASVRDGHHSNSRGKLGEDGGRDALGVLDGAHAVGSNVAAEGNKATAELGKLVLDVVRDLLVEGKALLERRRLLSDGLEGHLERVDELDGG